MTAPITDPLNTDGFDGNRTGIVWTRKQKVQALIGGLFLMLGLIINLHARTRGLNDVNWTYTLARLILSGENAYSPETLHSAFNRYHTWPGANFMPYPPSTGIVVIPLSLLSPGVAEIGWFLVLVAGTLGTVWLSLRYFASGMHPGAAILLVGTVFVSSCTRWAFASLQFAPAVNVLLAAFLLTLAARRDNRALLVSTLALCLKITNGLPFVIMALLQRRFKLAAGMILLCMAINLIGFARMGGISAVQGYRQNIAQVETKESRVNYPDPHERYALVRLDWQYLLNGIAPNIPRNRNVATLLTLLGLLWVFIEARRCRWQVQDTAAVGAFLGPVVCISLLAVYHHHYEGSLLILPILGYAFGPAELRGLPGAKLFVWVTASYIMFYAVNIEDIIARKFGMNTMLYPRMLGSAAVGLALFASLTALHAFANRRRVAASAGQDAAMVLQPGT